MIVDASALIAILRNDPEAEVCARVLGDAAKPRISAVNYVEAAVVIDASGDAVAGRRFDELCREAQLTIEPVTAEHARLARVAYREFGKGTGHRAKLNFGDCFAYALALASGEPLLFIGNDFIHTDIRNAREPDAFGE